MNKQTILFIAGGVVAVGIISALVYVLFFSGKNSDQPTTKYPESVQNAINNPVEKNENWSTLVDNEEYQISYSTSSEGDSFFITVNAEPVVDVAQKAEQALQDKLGAEKQYLCTLPVFINVPSMINDKLAEYNFGLSFCPGRIHISDIPQDEQTVPSSDDNIR